MIGFGAMIVFSLRSRGCLDVVRMSMFAVEDLDDKVLLACRLISEAPFGQLLSMKSTRYEQEDIIIIISE